jgi:hypothetical protein
LGTDKATGYKTSQILLQSTCIKLNDQECDVAVARLKEILKNTPDLKLPTQKQASIPIVVRIAKKIQHNLFATTITIKDNKICGGHHRYLATLLVNKFPKTVPGELSKDHRIYKWSAFHFSSVDFDSDEDREYYTLQTASDNGVEVAEIRNILNNSLIL